eukprot:PhM_4_TR10850/c0_g1_i1/m.56302
MELPPILTDNSYSYKTLDLCIPAPSDLVAGWSRVLSEHYHEVAVDVVPCPDLSDWGLAANGICGRNNSIVDLGGVPLMFDVRRQGTVFDVSRVMKDRGLDRGDKLVLGAGAGALTQSTSNSELVANCLYRDGKVVDSRNMIGYISDMNMLPPATVAVNCPPCCCCTGCLANLFVCDGAQGQDVVRVRVGGKKSQRPADPHDTDLTRLVRKASNNVVRSAGEVVGLGGAMRVTGATMVHVMPPYYPLSGAYPSANPRLTMKGWGEVFFETTKPLVALPVLLSSDGPSELGLRAEHTHFYSEDKTLVGHYHYDTSDDGRVEAYFSCAKTAVKVSAASSSSSSGKSKL